MHIAYSSLSPTLLDPARYPSPMEVDRFPDLQASVAAHRLISDRLACESIVGLSKAFQEMDVSSVQFHSTNDRAAATHQQHSHLQPRSVSDTPVASHSASAQTVQSSLYHVGTIPTSSSPGNTINAITSSSSRRRTAAAHRRSHQLSAVAAARGHSHSMLKVTAIKKSVEKKQTLACLSCRWRKITCGRPPFVSWDQTCLQCFSRQLTCVYPTESRRGQHR